MCLLRIRANDVAPGLCRFEEAHPFSDLLAHDLNEGFALRQLSNPLDAACRRRPKLAQPSLKASRQAHAEIDKRTGLPGSIREATAEQVVIDRFDHRDERADLLCRNAIERHGLRQRE
jgi:hypothetical protein